MKEKYPFDKQIIDLYTRNKKITKSKIAELCHCSVSTVDRALERAGLKEISLSKNLENIYDDVIKDFQENHLYCKEIANKYSIGESSVYKILNKAKIKRQSGYHSNCKLNYFAQIDTPNKAYLLGFITADGAIVNEVLSIEVHQDDVEVLNFAKQEINPEATLTPTRNCYKVTFGAKQLGRDLAKYGIVQNKSKTIKRVPIEYIPNELLPFYFRGLIDGDGCIHKDGKLSIYSGSYDFIQDVQRILIEQANLQLLNIYKGTTFFITWGGYKDKCKLFHYLYDDLNATYYYPRKYNRLLQVIQDNTEVTN